MNRAELVKIVARQTGVDFTVVDDVIDASLELIVLTLAADEEVGFKGFGKFRPQIRRASQLRNPRTGEALDIGERKTVHFSPSITIKRRLNGDIKRSDIKPWLYSGRTRPDVEEVHRVLWDHSDKRNRVVVRLQDLAEQFKIDKTSVHETMMAMRGSGRISYMECRTGRRFVYEVADPERFDRNDPDTKVGRKTLPSWG